MNSPLHEIIITPEYVPAYIVIHDASMAFGKNSIPHWHEELELICTLDSRIHVRRDQEDLFVNENDLVVIEKGQVHTSIPIQGYANRCISIAYHQNFLQKHGIKTNQHYFYLEDKPEEKSKIIQCMEQLDHFYRDNSQKEDPYRNLMTNSLVFTIAYFLLSCAQDACISEPITNTLKYKKRYCSILSYIQEHYNEPLTLNDIAAYSSLSKEHLSRDFKTYVGEGFREHLTNIRIMKAQNDLLNSDIPLIDLAVKHGFTDLRSYNRAFKKRFNISPAQYRRNQKRKVINNT